MTDDAWIGRTLGRYQITRLIGAGGMSRVYLGEQAAIGSRVAIKILGEDSARDADLLERFFAEARAVNLIAHENIVSVLDLDRTSEGRPYIVMEYVDGCTLARLVRGQHAPLAGVIDVVCEALQALHAAHAIGIVHRDLKPDNVLVTAEGHAKVSDFGIAKLAPGLPDRVRTRTGVMLGTPAFMAPEQIRGAEVDARTDVYAAGVMLFEAVTGSLPFSGTTDYEVLEAHLEKPAPSPRAARPELPVEVERVILRAMAKRPEERFATAHDMADVLHEARKQLPDAPLRRRPASIEPANVDPTAPTANPTPPAPSAVQPPPSAVRSPPPRERTRRRELAIGLVGGAVLATAAVLAVQAIRGGGRDGDRVASGNGGVSGNHAGGTGDPNGTGGSVGDRQANAQVVTTGQAVGGGSGRATGTNGGAGGTGEGGTGGANTDRTGGAGGTGNRTGGADETFGVTGGNGNRTGGAGGSGNRTGGADGTFGVTGGNSNRTGGEGGTGGTNSNRTGGAGGANGNRTGGAGGTGVEETGVGANGGANGPAPTGSGGKGAPANGNAAVDPSGTVHVGPNVHLGEHSPRRERDGKLPGDVHHFDALAFLPTARSLARELVPDAELVQLQVRGVFPDGHADLALSDGYAPATFRFRGEAESHPPPGEPRTPDWEGECVVEIEVSTARVHAWVVRTACGQPTVKDPSCSLAQIWKRAIADGVKTDQVALIRYDGGSRWAFNSLDLSEPITCP